MVKKCCKSGWRIKKMNSELFMRTSRVVVSNKRLISTLETSAILKNERSRSKERNIYAPSTQTGPRRAWKHKRMNEKWEGKKRHGTLWCERDFQTDEQRRTLGVKRWVGGVGGPGSEGELGCVEGSPPEEELNRQIRANGPWWCAFDPTVCAPLDRHESRYS